MKAYIFPLMLTAHGGPVVYASSEDSANMKAAQWKKTAPVFSGQAEKVFGGNYEIQQTGAIYENPFIDPNIPYYVCTAPGFACEYLETELTALYKRFVEPIDYSGYDDWKARLIQNGTIVEKGERKR